VLAGVLREAHSGHAAGQGSARAVDVIRMRIGSLEIARARALQVEDLDGVPCYVAEAGPPGEPVPVAGEAQTEVRAAGDGVLVHDSA
jgi:hypothetical protein